MAKDYHVFISHSWDHLDDLKELRELLEERGYFNVEFEEVSPEKQIKSTDEDYIKRRLRERIRKSHIVLGLAGIYASYSDWMEWELDTAIKESIPIVGIIPQEQERISKVVKDRAEECVGWDIELIVAAIRKYANDPDQD